MSVHTEPGIQLLPSGDMRIVFAGPLRILKFNLTRPGRLDPEGVRRVAREIEREGLFKIRATAQDKVAHTVFNLAGTKDSLFPLGLIDAFELPVASLSEQVRPHASRFVGKHSPFKSWEITAAVLRLFENGYGAVIVTIDFRVDAAAESEDTSAFLRQYFSFESELNISLRECVKATLNKTIPGLCRRLAKTTKGSPMVEGQVRFLSTFYVLSSEWSSAKLTSLAVPTAIRSMVQPEANDPLLSQSNSPSELICFTSGFHLYIWNRKETREYLPRAVSLVSFLNLMNILYGEIDDIKDEIAARLKSGRTPFFAPTDLDEKLEIMYGEIMVSSATWRRDFSSFRNEIDRRWLLGEAKRFCFTLIAALEARSARKRALVIGGLIALFTLTQIVSVIEDGAQLLDRINAPPGVAVSAEEPAAAPQVP